MTFARACGIAVQALVLGVLLFIAVSKLMELEAGMRVFRYQAF